MKKKYLAYIALLAGWICFCYWLYAKSISPRINEPQEKSRPEESADLPFPLTFRWGSDVPEVGFGFSELKTQLKNVDSTDALVIVRGFFFRDEADSINQCFELGNRRIQNVLKILNLDKDRILAEVLPQGINADVRSNPFEAIRFERFSFRDIMEAEGDTVEICFPLKDSLILPAICYDRLDKWVRKSAKKKEGITYIVGTADGSGIAESNDMALERAIVIKNRLLQEGWKEDQIQLSSGQRNHPLTLRNRCVIIYFE